MLYTLHSAFVGIITNANANTVRCDSYWVHMTTL